MNDAVDPQVIVRALKVMDCDFNRRGATTYVDIPRVGCDISLEDIDSPYNAALFIGEAKAFLREQRYRDFGVIFTARGPVQLTVVEDLWGATFEAPTEHEAYAQAVLAVSPREVK